MIKSSRVPPSRPAAAPRALSGQRVFFALLAVLALAFGVVTGVGPAAADTAPTNPADPATPPTVSADPLPTVQHDGVAWDQEVVGNTVFVAGRFTYARPAGAEPGTQLTARNNMLAYDITTGNLITSFAPDLNGQALAVAASPDGTRVYVGGEFTLANGQTRNRIAAYDTATGALISTFKPSVFGPVRALAATNTTVYVGGSFNAIGPGGLPRKNFAAFNASNGAILPWAPATGEGTNQNGTAAKSSAVQGLVVLPALNKVIAVGRFGFLNGVVATGVGALDATTGSTLPFAVSTQFTNDGDHSAFLSISTDGTNVYGTAYDFYSAVNFEGTFAARASDGEMVWVADCKGDHYQAYRSGSAIYSASHAHDCSYMRAFPEVSPRAHHHAHAVSLAATTTVTGGLLAGKPAPSMLAWAPDFTIGTFTGQKQGPWSVDGNSQYVVYGGEFTYVNATKQQGLTRFAVAQLAPNLRGPRASTGLDPTLTVPKRSVGTIRVTWRTTYDQDNENLTYRVVRNGNTAAPIYVTTVPSKFWTLSNVTFDDTGLPTGTYTYQIYAFDPFGNQVAGATKSLSVTGVAGTPNSPPTAAFTHTTDGLTASFDGTGSTDTDGTISSYAWTFGDGTTATGPTASRTYAVAGTYSVQLLVTDDDGATGVLTKSVTVAPASAPLASDSFTRSVAGGLGTADAGGPWTVSPAAACSVNGSAAVLSTGAGVTVNASLNSVSSADTAVQVQVALDRPATGSGTYVSVVARKIGTTDYRVRLRVFETGVVNATLFRSVNGVLTELQRLDIPGLTYTPGQVLNVRLDVSGSGTSTVQAKVWSAGAAEPGWQLSRTDSTAELQGPGAVGVATYVAATATNGPAGISFDNFWAGAAGTAPPP
ncbi:MAG: PKD domain-containing protein [Actinomycetota bacterium]|nr:PKD domain-containing protein [Actinomycetota bacterium]